MDYWMPDRNTEPYALSLRLEKSAIVKTRIAEF